MEKLCMNKSTKVKIILTLTNLNVKNPCDFYILLEYYLAFPQKNDRGY